MKRSMAWAWVLVLGTSAGCTKDPPDCPAGTQWRADIRWCVPPCRDTAETRCYRDTDAEAGVGEDAAIVAGDSGADVVTMDADGAVVDATNDADGDGATRATDPAIEPPRAIAPLSTSRVTSHSPTLRWQNAVGVGGAVIELSRSRDFSSVERVERASGDRLRVGAALTPGVWFWRLRGAAVAVDGARTSAAWWFRVGARSAATDTSWGSELDVNGDGYADIAVGSPEADMGRGRVDVFYGGPGGVAVTPSVTLRGAAPQDGFGSALASAGDVNGDGFGDLIVGAPRAEVALQRYAGRATVYLGGASGLGTTAQATIEGAATGDAVGRVLAGVGDINGDGFSEVAVGVPSFSFAGGTRSSAGVTYIFNGSSAGTNTAARSAIEGAAAGDLFGSAIASGDINGDGFADIAIGAVGSASERGHVSVLFGSALGVSSMRATMVVGAVARDLFGAVVAGCGDMNGDGYSDLAVGSPGAQMGAGMLTLFAGGAGAAAPALLRQIEGSAVGDGFGGALSMQGDVDSDGLDDVVVGAPGATVSGRMSVGRASILTGSTTSIAYTPQHSFVGSSAGAQLGSSASIVGDVNHDGVADLAIAAQSASPTSRERAGSVLVLLGVRSAAPMLHRTLEGAASFDSFGSAIAAR
jgi:hypothetical protein